jgi:hypothetical protein
MSCSHHDDCDPERIGEIMAPLKKQLEQAEATIATLRGVAHRPLPDHGWTCTICRQPLQYVMAGEKVIPMANGTAVVVCPACVDRAVRASLDAGKETRNG